MEKKPLNEEALAAVSGGTDREVYDDGSGKIGTYSCIGCAGKFMANVTTFTCSVCGKQYKDGILV